MWKLGRKHRAKLPALDLAVICWALTLKAQATKEEIDKLDFMKIKIFCAPKDTINHEKATYRMWDHTGKLYV